MESGLLVSGGRWYFITYPFRSDDHREAYIELVDIGPIPPRGPVARIERTRSTVPPYRELLVCPDGVVPADVALALLTAAGITPTGPGAEPRVPGSLSRPLGERPRYQEAAYLLTETGQPMDGVMAGLVGVARVLLELSAEALGSSSSRALLGDVIKNLVLGVEDPDALGPD